MKALSIMQPWAWLIVHGHKDIENRLWKYAPKYRGPILIHASKTIDKYAGSFEGVTVPDNDQLLLGGIVGSADLVDVVTTSDSQWFMRNHLGFVLKNAKTLPFLPCKGMLGFFNITYPELDV